ncbi:hypothetical protein FPV67DRAFT_1500725, partial [Lyophyllum atratum]
MSKDRRKLVLVGDDGSGKSSLLAVFSGGTFPATPMVSSPKPFSSLPLLSPLCILQHPAWWTTIHVDVQIDDREVELCPYDTSSFEHMDRLRPMWYPESDAIIICFGLDSVDSLDNVKTKWAPEVLRFCPDVPFVLVGCKDHLRGTSQRCITREEVCLIFPYTCRPSFCLLCATTFLSLLFI